MGEREQAGAALKYGLISIDNDDSLAALAYIDSLSDAAKQDKYQHPFSHDVVAYMRKHESIDVLAALRSPKLHIDASEVGGDHEFKSEESKRLLAERISNWRP